MRNKPDVEYSSSQMDFNYFGVQGTLYKRINNVKVYHGESFHAKFFQISFSDNLLKVFDSNTS